MFPAQLKWLHAEDPRGTIARWVVALLAFLVSLLVRRELDTWLHDRDYVVFVPAIILTTYLVGVGPAVVVLLLSGVAVWYVFTPAVHSFGLDADSAVGLAIFLISGAVAIVIVHWLRLSIIRIAADLTAVTLLNELGLRLARDGAGLPDCMNGIVDTAISLSGADKGNIQTFDATSGSPMIAAQHGFDAPFLEFLSSASDAKAACGEAAQMTGPVIVEDVASTNIVGGRPSLHVIKDAGLRALISLPLMSSSGELLGVLSVYFGRPHRPTERDIHFLGLLTRQAADYLERKRAQETEKLLVGEINHRSNNQLAVVTAIARRCFSDSSSVAAAMEAFDARVSALARANVELAKYKWNADLREIIRSTLEPFAARTKIDGIRVLISPKLAQGFSLALHELATNATKYGALSNSEGLVCISWSIVRKVDINVLEFCWKERGGPPVVPPARRGFGTSLLKATFHDVDLDYAKDGLTCKINVPLESPRANSMTKSVIVQQ
jgi:two-component sensor histidine kinase